MYSGSHSPSISANGNTNGILWAISGPALYALDAVTLDLLYTTNQALNGRDKLPAVGHFATQTVANGRVYVATKTSLEAYGLFDVVNVISGSGQSSIAGTVLSQPIRVQAFNPYSGQPDVGATVNFSDGCKVLGSISCGTFNPASAVSDSTGHASTTYTLPKKAGSYTITVSGTGFSSTTATATAKAGPATAILANGGTKQTGPAGSTLPNPMVVKAQDFYKNGVAGITINFTATNGGVVTPTSAVTDSSGNARTSLTLPNTVGTVIVNATSPGFTNKLTFTEYSQ
jgi:hypothetical protein